MDSEPRYVGVSMLDGGRPLYLLAVKLKNVPGALGDVATRIGKAGLNILVTNDCSPPEGGEFTLSFFVEPKEAAAGEEEIRKAVMASPHTTECLVKKSESRLLVDDFAFPLMYFPSGRGVILPQSGLTAMFQDIMQTFGTGGESILFRAGHSAGARGTDDIAKAVGEEELARHAQSFVSLYSALGWGRMEVYEASADLASYKLKLSRGFESEGTKAQKPSCHFTRGLIAGSTERIFGEPVVCVEERCVGAGDPYCLFAVSRRRKN